MGVFDIFGRDNKSKSERIISEFEDRLNQGSTQSKGPVSVFTQSE